jgi:hypothetical protein
MGPPGALSLATGRRDCGRRCDWICRRGHGGGLGWFTSGARLLLVLHRSEPHTGVLGRLPVVEFLESDRRKCHDVTSDRQLTR